MQNKLLFSWTLLSNCKININESAQDSWRREERKLIEDKHLGEKILEKLNFKTQTEMAVDLKVYDSQVDTIYFDFPAISLAINNSSFTLN